LKVALDGGHHLALGAERDLADALEAPLSAMRGAELALGDEEGGLGRIAADLPHAVVASAQTGVAGQAAAAEQDDLLRVHRSARERVAVVLDAAVRRIADA